MLVEEGLGCVLGTVHLSEAGVLFDVPDEKGGFVDHGEFGDACRKINPVSDFDKITQSAWRGQTSFA
jgi:hypothetical protein